MGPGSSVGIATGYGLDGPGIESQWGQDFPYVSRPAVGPLPASCTMGTGSFPGVKSGRGMNLTPHPLLMPWSRKGKTIPLLPLWVLQSLSACTRLRLFLVKCYPNARNLATIFDRLTVRFSDVHNLFLPWKDPLKARNISSMIQRQQESERYQGERSMQYTAEKKLRGLSPRANYTDRAAAAGRRS